MRIDERLRRRLSGALPAAGKRRDGEKGQALVEFALVSPLLLLILVAIIQFGEMLNTYIVVTDAARTGARQLALEQGENDPCDPAVLAMMNSASSIGITASNVNSDMSIAFTSMSTPVTTPLPDYCVSTAGTPATASSYTYPAGNSASTTKAGAEVEGDEATMTVHTTYTLHIFGLKITTVNLNASASDAIE